MNNNKISALLAALLLFIGLAVGSSSAFGQTDYSSDDVVGQWELIRVESETGSVLKEQPEGMRDQIEFRDNYTVAIIKGQDKGLGMWKFYANRIVIADREVEQNLDFEVISISTDEMRLRTSFGGKEKAVVIYQRL